MNLGWVRILLIPMKALSGMTQSLEWLDLREVALVGVQWLFGIGSAVLHWERIQVDQSDYLLLTLGSLVSNPLTGDSPDSELFHTQIHSIRWA
jgi:hypothetical protein